MRLSKTATWALGILIIISLFAINNLLFLLKSEKTTGQIVGFHKTGIKRSSRVPKINFEYDGYSYTFNATLFSSANVAEEIPVIFDPDDPEDAYENTFGGFWLWGILYFAIIMVPWSAAALSFIGKNERLVISRKKIGLEKVSVLEDY